MKLKASKGSWERIIVPVAVVTIVIVIWLLLFPSTSRKKSFIHLTSTTKYTEYNRLTKMLFLGMGEPEVEAILGYPDQPIFTESNVQCWIYTETGPTAGWTYIAEFKRSAPSSPFKLCYTLNIGHVLFPDLGRSETGERARLSKEGEITVFGLAK